MTAIVDYQQAFEGSTDQVSLLPSENQVTRWADAVLTHLKTGEQELTVRFVGDDESQMLNRDFRGKDSPTNVLSFPFENPPGVTLNLLGDLIVCVPVIHREAAEQDKRTEDHYAHMIVHGILHLLGYDHIDEVQAEQMESMEIRILSQLGIDDPYQEH